MTISQAAAASGLSVDTIRYYEKAGMLPAIPRDRGGWRVFPQSLLDWLTNLARLRATGMPMAEMRRFAALVHGPATPDTLTERLAILHAHRARLAQRRAELDAAQAYLDHKISIYGKDALR